MSGDGAANDKHLTNGIIPTKESNYFFLVEQYNNKTVTRKSSVQISLNLPVFTAVFISIGDIEPSTLVLKRTGYKST